MDLKIFSQLLGQQNRLSLHVFIIDLVEGNHLAALMLEQLIYWSGRTKILGGWIAKSNVEWADELRLSKYQASACTKKLESMGLIITKKKRFNGAPTIHYKIQEKRLMQLVNAIVKKPEMESEKTGNGLSRNLTMDCKETSLSDCKETSLSITEPIQNLHTEPTTISPSEKIYQSFLSQWGISQSQAIDQAIFKNVGPDDWPKIEKHLPAFLKEKGKFSGSARTYLTNQKWLTEPVQAERPREELSYVQRNFRK